MSILRRLRAAVTHTGPGYDLPPIPARGDDFEAWLRAQRDEHRDDDHGRWSAYDDLLDRYRLHADTHTPLGEHVCEGRVAGDCQCLEVADA
jgi:hypothetical protein